MPKIADLGAVAAHIVLTLLTSADSRPSTRAAAEETADACRVLYASADPIDGRLRPCLLWWSAAVESALAFNSTARAARAHHRGRAVRDIRRAGSLQPIFETMNGGHITDASAAVFIYAPMLALAWFPLSRLGSPRTAISYCHAAMVTSTALRSPQLLSAAQAVYERLKSEHPDCAITGLDADPRACEAVAARRLADQARGALASNDPIQFGEVMDTAVQHLRDAFRPELLDPAAGRTLLELAAMAASDSQSWAADNCARLLEASALAAQEHMTVDLSVSKINRHAAFEALFHRSLLAGTLQRSPNTPRGTPDPCGIGLGGRLCLWVQEVDMSLGTIVAAWKADGGPVVASVSTLTPAARLALQDLADGRPSRMTTAVRGELGDKLLGGIARAELGSPRSVIVIPSMALRSLPVEALTAGGEPIIGIEAAISVAPALSTWAALPPPPRLSSPYRLLGVFDKTLPGARAEMDHLRALGRSGVIDGQAVLSASKLGAQLGAHPYMVLTLAVHGSVSPAGLTLRLPGGTATGLDFLGWRLPPIVVLAACRSGSPGTIRWPIDLAAACLHRGTSSVIVSRWPIADDTVADVMMALYESLGQGATPGAALRSAVRCSPEEHLSSWANLTVFGRAD